VPLAVVPRAVRRLSGATWKGPAGGGRAGGVQLAAGPAGRCGLRRQGVRSGVPSPDPDQSGEEGGSFFLCENTSKVVPRGNRVISIVESHLSGLCSRYLLTAHGQMGIEVKIN